MALHSSEGAEFQTQRSVVLPAGSVFVRVQLVGVPLSERETASPIVVWS